MSKLWLTAVAPTPQPTFAVSGWNRCRPLGNCARRHRGLDFRARIGTPIFSILPGTVVQVKTDPDGDAGKMVVVQHEGGLLSRYLHLSRTLVLEGQFVVHGQRVGLSGDTGAPGQPHLHFDLLLPEDQIPAYIRLYGKPATGFGGTDEPGMVKVPAEPVVPINAGNRHVFREAKQARIPVRFEPFVRANALAFFIFPAIPQLRATPFAGAPSEISRASTLLAIAAGIGIGTLAGFAASKWIP